MCIRDRSESASVDAQGRLNVTLCNTALDAAKPVEMLLDSSDMKLVEGRILTGAMGDFNDFDAPERVHSDEFDAVACDQAVSGTEVRFPLPACSVVRLPFEAAK